MQKFVEVRSNEKGHDKENIWFDKCRRDKTPYITLKARVKLANVHWDYIAYPSEMDLNFDKHKDFIVKKAVEIFNKYASSKSDYRISSGLVYFNDLELSNARLAAMELYDLVGEVVNFEN
jgi:hypothetical protein